MTGKYTGVVNPHNDLSRQLVKDVRNNQPSLRTIGKWRIEWVEKGYDKRMTFQSYKKGKCKQWHQQRYQNRQNTRNQQVFIL
jgi:hypothetical protein